MQITALKINNMIGARRVDLQIATPVVLFCGANGASKSSVQESVRMAFTGHTLRVELKKEYPMLVSDGAKKGSVVVTTDCGTVKFELPSGEHTLTGDLNLGMPEALPYVLNAQAFASMSAEARRTFLFSLTGCKVTPAEVKRRLLEKECEEAHIDMTLPMLRSGFPAAAEFAAKKATESKGAWKALSGSTWGSKKAEDWTAEKPEVDQELLNSATLALAEFDSKIAATNQELGAIQAKINNSEKIAAELAKNKALADRLTRLREKLALDQASLVEYEAAVLELSNRAGTSKKEGLVHDMARFLDSLTFDGDLAKDAGDIIARYENEHGPIAGGGDPEAANLLPANIKSRDLMKSCVSNGHRDIASAEVAQQFVDNNSSSGDHISMAGERDALTQRLVTLRRDRIETSNACDSLNDEAKAARNADATTKNAAAHHEDVVAWLKIADSLAPDGIPAEMLAQALRPINAAMRESSISTGWRPPIINADMTIHAEGRPYTLLSKSEKWRVDAMIAAAIAQLSEVRILMLDEVDILELSARAELLMWMDELATAGALNSVLLFSTMKQLPTGIPDTIEAVWLENGVIPAIEAAEAEAAA